MVQILQDSICRICGCEDAVFINLLNPKNLKLLDLVQRLLLIEIKHDYLPKDICHSCITTLHEFQELERTCKIIQRRLTNEQNQSKKEQNKSFNGSCHRVSVITEVGKTDSTNTTTTAPASSSRACVEIEPSKVQKATGGDDCIAERSATLPKIDVLNVASINEGGSLQNGLESETEIVRKSSDVPLISNIIDPLIEDVFGVSETPSATIHISTPENNDTCFATTSNTEAYHILNQNCKSSRADNPKSGNDTSGKVSTLISDVFVNLLQKKTVPNRNAPKILVSYLNKSCLHNTCPIIADESFEWRDADLQEQILPAACSSVSEEQETLDENVIRDTIATAPPGQTMENIIVTKSSGPATTCTEVPSCEEGTISEDSIAVTNPADHVSDAPLSETALCTEITSTGRVRNKTREVYKIEEKKNAQPFAAAMTTGTKVLTKQSDSEKRLLVKFVRVMVKMEPEESSPVRTCTDSPSGGKNISNESVSNKSSDVAVTKTPLMGNESTSNKSSDIEVSTPPLMGDESVSNKSSSTEVSTRPLMGDESISNKSSNTDVSTPPLMGDESISNKSCNTEVSTPLLMGDESASNKSCNIAVTTPTLNSDESTSSKSCNVEVTTPTLNSDESTSNKSCNAGIQPTLMGETVKVKKEHESAMESPSSTERSLLGVSLLKIPNNKIKPFQITLNRKDDSTKPEKYSSNINEGKSDTGKKSSSDGWLIYSIPENNVTLHVCQKCQIILLSESAKNEHQCAFNQSIKQEESVVSNADRRRKKVMTMKRDSSSVLLNHDNGNENHLTKQKKKKKK